MFKICKMCLTVDTKGNELITIQLEALDRIAAGMAGAAPALPTPPGPDLQPTGYCTSMWNGRRCNGEHSFAYGTMYHASTRDDDSLQAIWADGYDGLDIHRTPYELNDQVDVDPSWSALDTMHAESAPAHPWLSGSLHGEVLIELHQNSWLSTYAHDDVYVTPLLGGPPGALLDDGWAPFGHDGYLRDLESEGWVMLGALAETFDLDQTAWYGTLLHV